MTLEEFEQMPEFIRLKKEAEEAVWKLEMFMIAAKCLRGNHEQTTSDR